MLVTNEPMNMMNVDVLIDDSVSLNAKNNKVVMKTIFLF